MNRQTAYNAWIAFLIIETAVIFVMLGTAWDYEFQHDRVVDLPPKNEMFGKAHTATATVVFCISNALVSVYVIVVHGYTPNFYTIGAGMIMLLYMIMLLTAWVCIHTEAGLIWPITPLQTIPAMWMLMFILLWIAIIVYILRLIVLVCTPICRRQFTYLRRRQLTDITLYKGDPCSICFDDLNERLQRLDCLHLYHSVCIKEWIDTCIAANKTATCPLCVYEIV